MNPVSLLPHLVNTQHKGDDDNNTNLHHVCFEIENISRQKRMAEIKVDAFQFHSLSFLCHVVT